MSLGQQKLLKFWLPDTVATAAMSLQYLMNKYCTSRCFRGPVVSVLSCLALGDLLFPTWRAEDVGQGGHIRGVEEVVPFVGKDFRGQEKRTVS